MQALKREAETDQPHGEGGMDPEVSQRVDAVIQDYFERLAAEIEIPKDIIDRLSGGDAAKGRLDIFGSAAMTAK